ncbi:hypothetical protein EO95_06905 [Methanosarcina sp. 1.H.T.1A.1]|uniref:hypothetical protein n=1 Tax=Methanosarcina sp. 1.H.T.1A.1 TaxID=1483602 RepID=UPI00062187C7|nr:hypothetical protein [Methanosarcina sp. 1.H.T.1A.1]KKI00206.1 hypothetical protein EO95_06905 [Methanosarcina sp. 1.H.T.1A.1]
MDIQIFNLSEKYFRGTLDEAHGTFEVYRSLYSYRFNIFSGKIFFKFANNNKELINLITKNKQGVK